MNDPILHKEDEQTPSQPNPEQHSSLTQFTQLQFQQRYSPHIDPEEARKIKELFGEDVAKSIVLFADNIRKDQHEINTKTLDLEKQRLSLEARKISIQEQEAKDKADIINEQIEFDKSKRKLVESGKKIGYIYPLVTLATWGIYFYKLLSADLSITPLLIIATILTIFLWIPNAMFGSILKNLFKSNTLPNSSSK